MPAPSRRALLRSGALGVATALAGCQSRNWPADDPLGGGRTRTTTDESHVVGESVSVGGATVTVSDALARESIVYPLLDTLDVAGHGGTQYLLAVVETEGGTVDPIAFDLQVGPTGVEGRRYLGTMSPSGLHPQIEGVGRAYDADTGRGWVGFSLVGQTEEGHGYVRLVHEGEEVLWRLPDDALLDLAAPAPSFDLRELVVDVDSDSDGSGDAFTVRVRVRNAGERAETFRGCVNVHFSVTKAFGFDVPPGEVREWTWTHRWQGSGETSVAVKTVAGETSTTLGG